MLTINVYMAAQKSLDTHTHLSRAAVVLSLRCHVIMAINLLMRQIQNIFGEPVLRESMLVISFILLSDEMNSQQQ